MGGHGDGGGGGAAAGDAPHVHDDRVLIYPRAVVSIVLDLPRAKKCYIVVKTKILDDVIELGRTESLESTGIEPLEFQRTVEVTYYTGIDDEQKAIFEVMDGDIMASSAFGYLFYSAVVSVGELFRGSMRLRMAREKEHLGYLTIRSEMDVTYDIVNVLNENKRSIAFFNSEPPTDQLVRDHHDKFSVPYGMYSIELLCRNILDHEMKSLSDSCYVITKMFLNVESFPTPEAPNWSFVELFSNRKLELWSSLRNYKKPYNVNALEIKVSHSQLTGELLFQRVLKKKTQRKLKLVVEVHVGGTEGELAPPERVSYCAFSVYKLLNAAGYPLTKFDGTNGKDFKWSEPIFRNFIKLKELYPDEEEDAPAPEADKNADDGQKPKRGGLLSFGRKKAAEEVKEPPEEGKEGGTEEGKEGPKEGGGGGGAEGTAETPKKGGGGLLSIFKKKDATAGTGSKEKGAEEASPGAEDGAGAGAEEGKKTGGGGRFAGLFAKKSPGEAKEVGDVRCPLPRAQPSRHGTPRHDAMYTLTHPPKRCTCPPP